MKTEKHYIA